MAQEDGTTVSKPTSPSAVEHIRHLVKQTFHCRPCLWQIRVVQELMKQEKDIVSIAATGSGKSLTFWIPLLLRPDGIQIIVTALNILGKQNVDSLAKVGIKAICITAETATEANFRAIEEFKYRAVITNIEMLSKRKGGFQKLWTNPDFVARIISIVWDEGQCIRNWKDFRQDYKSAGNIRYLMPKSVRFYLTSATLPAGMLQEIKSILGMRSETTHLFPRSNDRSNIQLVVRKMKYPVNSFMDLTFLVPKDWDFAQPLPYKFVIFFDNITESIKAVTYLHSLLPAEHTDKIVWFNSEMSQQFRDDESARFKASISYGMGASESFGMGIDLPNITLVIQYRAAADLSTLWQRFGRGARDPKLTATALFLVEPGHFDDAKHAKEQRKAARAAKARQRQADGRKRKKQKLMPTNPIATDRVFNHDHTPSTTGALTATTSHNRDLSPIPDLSNSHPLDISSPSDKTCAMTSAISTISPVDNNDTAAECTAPVITNNTPYESDNSGCESDESDVNDQDMWEQERLALYHKSDSTATKAYGRQREQRIVDPAVDDLINAGAPGRKFKCSRAPVNLFFGNDCTVSDHLECMPDIPGGCPRCTPQTPPICCEKCNPEAFVDFARVDLERKQRNAPRSRLKAYTCGDRDQKLERDLHAYRRSETGKEYGLPNLYNLGPGLFMSNEVLKRIVDCAHFFKITDGASLFRETRWVRAEACATDILTLITKHSPPKPKPALFTSAPLPSSASSSSTVAIRSEAVSEVNAPSEAAPPPKSRKLNQCSKCKAYGHNSRNRICPKHPSNAQLDKENIPPRS